MDDHSIDGWIDWLVAWWHLSFYDSWIHWFIDWTERIWSIDSSNGWLTDRLTDLFIYRWNILFVLLLHWFSWVPWAWKIFFGVEESLRPLLNSETYVSVPGRPKRKHPTCRHPGRRAVLSGPFPLFPLDWRMPISALTGKSSKSPMLCLENQFKETNSFLYPQIFQ